VIRQAYVQFLEEAARRIHLLDHNRPVIVALGYNNNIDRALHTFYQHAPSVDFLGINLYQDANLGVLDSLIQIHYPGKPYLISGFGGEGYVFSGFSNLDEKSEMIDGPIMDPKNLYAHQWNTYILPKKGNNLGGFAFCWRDQMEGTVPLNGLTDIKRRLKPSYYALQEAWTGSLQPLSLPKITINTKSKVFLANHKYAFSATVTGGNSQNLTYEWRLYGTNAFIPLKNMQTTEDGEKISLKIPGQSGFYRLYLHASDQNGNVIVASLPIIVH
jgi:cellulose synthase (UDP-forming)